MKTNLKQWLPEKWILKSALWFLLLIIVPSFFLAYFSINAIKAERVASRQRILESHERLAEFAISEIHDVVKDVGDKWLEELNPKSFLNLAPAAQTELLQKLSADEARISQVFLVNTIGNVVYPANLNSLGVPSEENTAANPLPVLNKWVAKFQKKLEDAEELEFEENAPEKAERIYREIIETFPVPRLRAIALSKLARIYLQQSDWRRAYQCNLQIIENYPQEKDFNNLHLRFEARYRSVVTLENMNNWEAAMPALLTFYQDLLDHSDEVNRVQYEFFVERIQLLFQRIIGVYSEPQQSNFRTDFSRLQEQKKKSIGTKYLVEKLHQRLSRGILKRDKFREKLKYFSDFAAEQSYLVGYILLGKSKQRVVEAALGFQIDIDGLKQQIFPEITSNKKFPQDVALAVLDENKKLIMGDSDEILFEAVSMQPLRDPLDFWQLAIYPSHGNPLVQEGQDALYYKIWGVFLLWLFIIIGSGMVIYKMQQQRKRSLQKTTFISSVSHELRTPLTSIKMFVDFLWKKEHLRKDPETDKYLRIIRGESERLNRLVENVLDYAKIERGTKNYQFEYEESEAVIRNVVDTFQYHADVQGVAIDLDLAAELPEVYVDRHAISQALINLLSNAVKYSPEKKPVTLSAYPNGEYLNIRVQDRGMGIRSKDLDHIFEDYYRADDRQTENIAGTGLGLPLVKHIVKAHQGDVLVESEYGKGSTFTIKLLLEPA